MGIRLIALDIDGTLLDRTSQLPEANRDTVAEAVRRGFKVVLVTGRRFDFARPIAEQLAVPLTLVLNNGAVVKSSEGETLARQLLPRDVARKVLLATPEFRAEAAVVFDRRRERQVIFERIAWDDPTRKGYLERNREFLAEMQPLEASLDEDPIQVMYTGRVELMRRAAERLREINRSLPFAVAATEYEDRDFAMLDVIREGCSKGAALAEWARQSGIAAAEVMAIGDNWNDREMLEFAGLPVVMGNAVEGLKSLGWAVTLGNDRAGVAAAIREYAFEERDGNES